MRGANKNSRKENAVPLLLIQSRPTENMTHSIPATQTIIKIVAGDNKNGPFKLYRETCTHERVARARLCLCLKRFGRSEGHLMPAIVPYRCWLLVLGCGCVCVRARARARTAIDEYDVGESRSQHRLVHATLTVKMKSRPQSRLCLLRRSTCE